MGIFKNTVILIIHTFLWLLLSSGVCYGVISDVYCLRALKASLEDPLNYLSSSWNFNNNTEGFICKFNGVECWHPDSSKVLNLRLSDMGLKGEFPKGLENCSYMSGLDLSNNQLTGPIPSDIGKIPYMTKLDLSSNGFSGEIPRSLSNCQFLNVLKLDNNRLTGQIPLQLGGLPRLRTFSVTNNQLSGQIPTFVNGSFSASSYENNPGLCGKPILDVCTRKKKEANSGVIIGSAVGGMVIIFVICAVILFFLRRFPTNSLTTSSVVEV